MPSSRGINAVASIPFGRGQLAGIDLRRNIAILLLAEGRAAEAKQALQALHDDLCLVLGPEHEETREVAGILARLRIASRTPTSADTNGG